MLWPEGSSWKSKRNVVSVKKEGLLYLRDSLPCFGVKMDLLDQHATSVSCQSTGTWLGNEEWCSAA